MTVNIAIDGPAGAGKSTVARAAAKELGYIYVDTGALYRAVGVYALKHGIATRDAENIEKMLPGVTVELRFIDGEQQVFLNGENVSGEIRTPEASMAASDVSAIPAVRSFLFDLQRDIARKNNCLMDGRDIGTNILPNAELKIYLTASVDVRAKRRYDELILKGENPNLEDIKKGIETRDYQDMNRDIAPLKQADDAEYIDSSDMTIAQVVDKIVKLAKER